MRYNRLIIFSIASIGLLSCKKEAGTISPVMSDYQLNLVNGTLPTPNLPADNPLTVAKVELGRKLFYDQRLSRDNSISCASCHRQENAFSDPRVLSLGVNKTEGKRHAMAIFNMAWNGNGFFWDGRAASLREQSLMPIQDELEMHETLPGVIQKLSHDMDMKLSFAQAFGTTVITPENISLALESFMLSIVSDNSKYDQYLAGTATLTESEERGRVLFFTEYNEFFPNTSGADCAHCHAGNNFENDQYMNNGIDTDSEFTDFGYELVTGDPSDRAKFKVPSLRNIEVTGPYMHDGRFETLEEVVDHYNEHVKNSSTVNLALLSTTSTGLMLDEQDKIDLVNFLKTLTDESLLTNPNYKDPY